MKYVYLLWCRVSSPSLLLGVFSSKSAALKWLLKQDGSMTDYEKEMCDIEPWIVEGD